MKIDCQPLKSDEMKFLKIPTVLISLFFCLCFLNSCEKEKSYATSNPQIDVYVAGTETYGTTSIAKYWKNEKSINLTDGSKPAEARSIAVSGNDVFVAGWESNGTYRVATYWKNGKPVRLGDGSKDTYAYSVTVAGNDIYVAGIERSYTCNAPGGIGFVSLYWKNGKPFNASDGTYDAYAFGIAVSGNDVYVAGSEYNTTGYFGTYWKNGSPVRLSDFFTAVEAHSIAVSGNDVYVAGTDYNYGGNIAKLWKNGTDVHLTDDLNSYADCVTVSGKDVYVCGSEAGIAKYWKNARVVILDSTGSYANSIAIHGNQVYAVGAKRKGTRSIARLWKNGTAVDLSDGTTDNTAWGVFIGPR